MGHPLRSLPVVLLGIATAVVWAATSPLLQAGLLGVVLCPVGAGVGAGLAGSLIDTRVRREGLRFVAGWAAVAVVFSPGRPRDDGPRDTRHDRSGAHRAGVGRAVRLDSRPRPAAAERGRRELDPAIEHGPGRMVEDGGPTTIKLVPGLSGVVELGWRTGLAAEEPRSDILRLASSPGVRRASVDLGHEIGALSAVTVAAWRAATGSEAAGLLGPSDATARCGTGSAPR